MTRSARAASSGDWVYEYRRDAVCGVQPLEQFGYLLSFTGIE